MAPIKFEDKLKDKLENRTLEPSSDAWNTLAERLDKEDKTKYNTRFWWLGIAASIVGVILITTQFYKNTEDVKELPIVVETETNTQSNPKLNTDAVAIEDIITNSENEKVDLANTTEITSETEQNTMELPKQELKENAKLQLKEQKEVVASLEKSKEDIKDNKLVKVMSLEDIKIKEVVAEIQQLSAGGESSVTNKEIDSLLKQAQREILKQRIYNETTKMVDANALLQDVEVELDQSFRDKVFEALKSSYNSVKTAVVERRN